MLKGHEQLAAQNLYKDVKTILLHKRFDSALAEYAAFEELLEKHNFKRSPN